MPLLASLLHLELRDCSEVLFNSIRSASLTVLAIEKIADFSPLSEGIFVNNPFLSSLEITACQALCFPPSEFGNLATLKSLKIRWCEELSPFQQGFQNLKALEFLEIWSETSNCSTASVNQGCPEILERCKQEVGDIGQKYTMSRTKILDHLRGRVTMVLLDIVVSRNLLKPQLELNNASALFKYRQIILHNGKRVKQ
ncbi:hypothetical protein GH714_030224 [Hevea brasiliensis]|uniref:Uncharacterized protein n=1 Tax=Hevea brasiliensis TaxID=3981 RepID=A0A6A6N4W8_HEVBR|nr:hypothetical protein GH714_030224 [Hevea brasiliensis]